MSIQFRTPQKFARQGCPFSEGQRCTVNNACVLFTTVERLTNPFHQLAPELRLFLPKNLMSLCPFLPAKLKKYNRTFPSCSQQFWPTNQKESCSECNVRIHPCWLSNSQGNTNPQLVHLSTGYSANQLFQICSSPYGAQHTPDHKHIITDIYAIFPMSLKTAVVIPLLKKNDLNASVLSNYRPISNLPFFGKVIILNQLIAVKWLYIKE